MQSELAQNYAEARADGESVASQSVVVERAYHEYLRKIDEGAAPDPDQFCAQFPSVKSVLGKVIHAHLLLEKDPAFFGEEEPAICWPQPGETFLDYQLLLELGKGSFARVFLAREPKLGNRLVAIKVALRGAAEAEILGRIQHPNIVPVYSIQQDEVTELTVVCMPYAGAATLNDVLDHAFSRTTPPLRARLILDAVQTLPYPLAAPAYPPSPDRILKKGTYIDGIRSIGSRIADALEFIHERGICHRDLKPSNVLMTPEGAPMLLDFNLSADVADRVSKPGGTLTFMSPEQLQATGPDGFADWTLVDARSDIFSLGVILFQMLTGELPFGPVPENLSARDLHRHLMERQMEGRPAKACEVNPHVDASFSRLIERCLAYNPADRPQSAAEVAKALRKDLTPLRRVQRWTKRNQRVLFACAVVFLAFALAGVSAAAVRTFTREHPLAVGLEHYQHGRFPEALDQFNLLVTAEPHNASALFARGRVFQKMGEKNAQNYFSALADFQKAESIETSGRTRACLGYCTQYLQMPTPSAIAYYDSALRSGSKTAGILNNLGYCYLKQSDLKKAHECLDQAIAIAPHLQAPYHNRALVYLQKAMNLGNQLDSPFKEQEKPASNAEARNKQIRQEIAGHLQSGIKDIEFAIKVGPPSADLHYHAACLHAEHVRIGSDSKEIALHHLEEAVKRGIAPLKIANDVTLVGPLGETESFKKLVQRPAPLESPPPAVRFVDPLDGQFR